MHPAILKAAFCIGQSHDLNRLSWEVTAFQNAKPRAAVLYSASSMVYAPGSYQTLLKAYEALSLAGEKFGFVTEKQAATGGLAKYDVLIVPGATHVKPATLAAIRAFEGNGGQVVIVGEGALQNDERNEFLPAADRADLLGRVKIIPATTARGIRGELIPILESVGMAKLQLKEAVTGETVYGVEGRSIVHNGRTLLSVMNHGEEAVSARIDRNGAIVVPVSELVAASAHSGGELLELIPNTPYLFDLGELDKVTASLFYTGVGTAESDRAVTLSVQLTDTAGGRQDGLPVRFSVRQMGTLALWEGWDLDLSQVPLTEVTLQPFIGRIR